MEEKKDDKKVKFKEVYVTVVTLPKLQRLEVGSKTFNRFKSTYTDHKEYMNDRQVLQSYYDEAGKSVAFCKVYQIALGFVVNNSVRVKVITGTEKNVINEFHETLKHDSFKEAKLYGYNNEFLCDVVRFRARVNKIGADKEALQFKDILNKPWNRKLSCSLIDEVSKRNMGKVSLKNALHGAELDYSGIISIADLTDYYREGKINEINNSSAFFIKGLVDIKRLFDNEDNIRSLSFDITVAEESSEKEVNVLDHVLSSGELTRKVITAIVNYTEKENLDPDLVLDLVKTAISKTKTFQKVAQEDYITLKEELGLVTDYSLIRPVVDKGNLGKAQANELIKMYKNSIPNEKYEVIELVEKFLLEHKKSEQITAKKSLILLKENL